MSYIAPNSTIKLLHNVPLDMKYEHTIFFNSKEDQYNYFYSKTKYTYTAQSYQRVKRGWIRLGVLADDIYDCNYLMFQNTNFGDKWFYAFITSVEYINNSVSEIEFEIDVMQTWATDYTLNPCFVEREHRSQNDTFPLFTDEKIEAGTLTYGDFINFDMSDMNICVLSAPDTVSGHIYNGVYVGCSMTSVFPLTEGNLPEIDSYIQQLTIDNDEIIAMYQVPRVFLEAGAEGQTRSYTVSISRPNYLDGTNPYTPKNEKLLYYPYSFIRVTGLQGEYSDYSYELFNDNSHSFSIKCSYHPDVTVVITPLYYKNLPYCYDEKFTISDFPICSWAIDTFERWWANNKYKTFTDGIITALQGALTGGAEKSFTNLGSYLIQTWGKMQTADNAPNVHSNTTNGNINSAMGMMEIHFYPMSIKRERAICIDSYFEKYGYATQRIKVPNRNVRPYWCYTKTVGCTISANTGYLPAVDKQKICDIYDNGITFWKNGNQVGNYLLNNHYGR